MNVPSAPAVPAIDDPFASLRASSVVRAWVLPLILTALPLTMALFFGDVIVIFGGDCVEHVADDRATARTRRPARRS